MPLIEKITQMQNQGLGSEEIIKTLQDEGVSPREINEALEQITVKSAVSTEASEPPIEVGAGEMQPSLMTSEESPQTSEEAPQEASQISQTQVMQPQIPSEETYFPYPPTQPPQEYAEQYPSYQEQAPQMEQYPQAPQYAEQYAHPAEQTQEQYSQYAEYQYPSQAAGTDIITEIAEQIVDEKFQKIQNQLSETIKFKIETEGKVNDISERLKRIEMIIDRLQSSIIGKIGSYEKDLSSLKQELETTQESFSKVLAPLAEKEKPTHTKAEHETETKKHEHKAEHKQPETRHHKKSDALAHYLRR